LFDLTAELPAPRLPDGAAYDGVPCLDLVPVRAAARPGGDLVEAVRRLAALRDGERQIWVACALGYARSASVVAAWLCAETGCTVQEAVERVRRARPRIALDGD
jgi:protein phosphatase